MLIFRLLYSWQILPLYVLFVSGSTAFIFIHYIHSSTTSIFRRLYSLNSCSDILYAISMGIWSLCRNDERAGASARRLIQMSHFITTGVIKPAGLLSLFQKKQKKIFLSETCSCRRCKYISTLLWIVKTCFFRNFTY